MPAVSAIAEAGVTAGEPRAPRALLGPELVVLLWWLTPALLSLVRVAPVYIHHFADTFPAQFILMAIAADTLARLAGGALARIPPLVRAGSLIRLGAGTALAIGAASIQLSAFALYLPFVEAHPLETFFGVPLSYDLATAHAVQATASIVPIVVLGSGEDTVGVDEHPTVLSSVASPDIFQFADPDQTLAFPSGDQATFLLVRSVDDGLDAALAPWRAAGGPLSSQTVDLGANYEEIQGRGPGTWLPPDWHQLDVPLEDQSQIVGYSMPRQLKPGVPAQIDVAWRVGQPAADPRQQSVFAHVVDDKGTSRGGQDFAPIPSSAWSSGETMVDRFTITPPKDLPPGRYWVEFGRYQRPQIAPVRVVADGEPGPTSVRIGPLAVAPTPKPVAGLREADATFGAQVSLDGWKATQSGNQLTVVLLWRANKPPADSFTVFVHLVGSNGQIVAQNDSEPRGGKFPTSDWNPGDQVADRHLLSLDGVKPGQYLLELGMYASDGKRLSIGKGDSLTVGPVVVSSPSPRKPVAASTPVPTRVSPTPARSTPTPARGGRGQAPTTKPTPTRVGHVAIPTATPVRATR